VNQAAILQKEEKPIATATFSSNIEHSNIRRACSEFLDACRLRGYNVASRRDGFIMAAVSAVKKELRIGSNYSGSSGRSITMAALDPGS